MLPLHDAHVRLALLNHIAVRLGGQDAQELRAAGIENELLEHLQRLSAADLHRLAAMREPMFAVSVDADRLKAGLRALAVTNEAKAQETYFIRHGASWTMMKKLFKVRHKLTLQRRRELGVHRLAGRLTLPEPATRERIWRIWAAITDTSPRARYYQLHQAFPDLSLEVLEIVVAEFEKDRYVAPANPVPRSPAWQRENEQHAKWHPQPSPI
ncbi:MAG: hypothetical protein A3I63_08090 [Betaproteobacteria bacterium RIFCSPLOWO2_02_FULL_66_14]|nr:MAG: hypothetical protein A3I63_08090 [Betaproteobacteria bacterium RIFCSPLOWO2_02_FULL_66_14]